MMLLPLPWALALTIAGLAWGWCMRGRSLTTLPVDKLLRQVPWLGGLLLIAIGAVTLEAVYDRNAWLEWFWPDTLLIWTLPVCRAVLFLTLGLLTGLAQGDGRKRPAIVGAAALLVCLWFNGVAQPVTTGPTRILKGVILQSTGATCMPASAANIAHRLGMDLSEAQLAAYMGTTEHGTTVPQAVYGLQRAGLHCERVRVHSLHEVSPPAILLVGVGEEDHAVAFVGWQGPQAEIWDPNRGRRFMTEAQLQHWTWHGHALLIHL